MKSLLFRSLLSMTLLMFLAGASSCKKKTSDPSSVRETVTDYDGNVYQTVTIGSQVWILENLKVTHYLNGDIIPEVMGDTAWSKLSTGACCRYENDSLQSAIYGLLYNWYALTDVREICPEGWHVATDEDWNTLITYLGGEQIAGGKMKEAGLAHWAPPNTGATNSSSFTALPAGARSSDGQFYLLGNFGLFWTATSSAGNYSWYRYLEDVSELVGRTADDQKSGFSVRCVKD